jgi:hypothetical protein
MTKRIAAIVFIFVCSTTAWIALGSTLLYRTYSANDNLNNRVQSVWGTPQAQTPPAATYPVTVEKRVEVQEGDKKVERIEKHNSDVRLPLEGSQINVDLGLDYRQKGLLWYSTYKVNFSGLYTFRNSTNADQPVTFAFTLPAKEAIYDDMLMAVDDQSLQVTTSKGCLSGTAKVAAGKSVVLHVAYRSQGLDTWRYRLGEEVAEVKQFNLKLKTNFDGFDFPENTLAPSEKQNTSDGWILTWSYRDLLSGFEIGLKMPEKPQPGPLAGQISFFAPVSLFFFFFLIFILTMLRGIEVHPMNYFFLACAFFAFHLLLAYLVDHISIHVAFLICSAMSMFLVWSYLRLVVGKRFASEAALAQFGYLVLFSYAFFFKGYTGLAITIGAILTLFIVMQTTGNIRWAEKLARKAA